MLRLTDRDLDFPGITIWKRVLKNSKNESLMLAFRGLVILKASFKMPDGSNPRKLLTDVDSVRLVCEQGSRVYQNENVLVPDIDRVIEAKTFGTENFSIVPPQIRVGRIPFKRFVNKHGTFFLSVDYYKKLLAAIPTEIKVIRCLEIDGTYLALFCTYRNVRAFATLIPEEQIP